MATIVLHRVLQKRYILLGTGYAAAASEIAPPDWYQAQSVRKRERFGGVCLCDEEGRLHWARDEDVEVVTVDSRSPKSLLDPETYR